MAAKKEACKNHPKINTGRHCFHCHQPICPECQRRYAHHLFCSVKCYVLWQTRKYLQPLLKRPEILIIVLFILFFQPALYFLLSPGIDELEEKHEISAGKKGAVAEIDTMTYQSGKLWIDSVRYELKKRINIKLKTDKNVLYSIWNGGVFVDAVTGRNEDVIDLQYLLNPGMNAFTIWRMDNEGTATLLDSFSIKLSSYRQNVFSRSINRIRINKKLLALTFDGGSSNRGTAELLDVLDSLKIRSTIFLTGQFIRHFPEIVKRIVADGHEVGNHTYSHPHLTSYEENSLHETLPRVTREFLQNQLLQADSLYQSITGQSMAPLWRAPYGELNQDILGWAAELGYLHINWSKKCDSWDWVSDTTSQLYRNNQQLLEHFLNLESERGLQGKIILMHLSSERPGKMPYRILSALSDSLLYRGYQFSAVGDMLRQSDIRHIYSYK